MSPLIATPSRGARVDSEPDVSRGERGRLGLVGAAAPGGEGEEEDGEGGDAEGAAEHLHPLSAFSAITMRWISLVPS